MQPAARPISISNVVSPTTMASAGSVSVRLNTFNAMSGAGFLWVTSSSQTIVPVKGSKSKSFIICNNTRLLFPEAMARVVPSSCNRVSVSFT